MFPTPGQQALAESQRNVDAYGESDRFWSINRLEALYNGQQYEGLPSFWNRSVPVIERAPHIQSRYARAAVDRVAHFVFGRRRFPRITVQPAAYGVALTSGERAALGAVVTDVVAAARLPSVALAYLTEGLKTRAAVAVCGLRAGLPHAQILRPLGRVGAGAVIELHANSGALPAFNDSERIVDHLVIGAVGPRVGVAAIETGVVAVHHE